NKASLSQLAGSVGLDLFDLDTTRPAVIAMTLPDAPQPGATMILPVKSTQGIGSKVKRKLPSAIVDTAGGFAAITPEGPYKRSRTPSPLMADLPAGDLVVRIDADALWKTYGPMAMATMAKGLGASRSAGGSAAEAAAMVKTMVDGLGSTL